MRVEVRRIGVVEIVGRGWGRVVDGFAVIKGRMSVSGVKMGSLEI